MTGVFTLFERTCRGPGWAFIRKFNKDQDGHGAYYALKAQAEGQSAITTRLNKAYAMIQNASYNGCSKNFTFDKLST
jgi:hypothetical protein